MLTRHLFLSARCAPSETYRATIVRPWRAWVFCEFEFGGIVDGVRRSDSTPGGFAGCLFVFVRAGATRYESPQGFRAAGPARFFALRYAARRPSAERKGLFSLLTRHLFLSAQARLGKRTGLLSFVPDGTGVLRTRACRIPRRSEKRRPDTRRLIKQ